MGLSPPSAKKNLGPIPMSIFEWDLFHLEAVGLIPWDLVDFTFPVSKQGHLYQRFLELIALLGDCAIKKALEGQID